MTRTRTRTLTLAILLALVTTATACDQAEPEAAATASSEEAATADQAAAQAPAPPAKETVTPEPAPAAQDEQRPPAKRLADGTEIWGSELNGELALTPLSELQAKPADFNGKLVRTEGEIARVCKKMGCWMELRSSAEAPAVFVPLAGHAFFLPERVIGKQATIEGKLTLKEMPEATKKHLTDEGATAEALAFNIEATGVAVR